MVIEVLTMSFTVELHTKLRRCSELHHQVFQPRKAGIKREVPAVASPYAFRHPDAHALGRQTVKNDLTTIR